jgi:UDP-3-O-[3-hydroxymyristoyl] N-acetylglucosamine deacetylase
MTNRLLRALFARPDAWEFVECGLPTGQKLPGVGVLRSDIPVHC